MSDERLSYRFGPLERRGLLGPVRGGQAIAIAVALGLAMLTLDQAPSVAGVVIGLSIIGLAVATTTLPIAGHTAEQWAPIAGRFTARRLRGRHLFRSDVATAGMSVRPERRSLSAPEPKLPRALAGVKLLALDTDRGELGVISEQRGRRLTAVLACRALSFALLDPDSQERRLAGWGMVLSAAGRTPVRRLQWVERTAPARGDELAHWLHEARDPAVPLRGTPIVESYLELIGASTRVTHEHEVLLAIQVDAARTRGMRNQSLESVLVEQTEWVARGLESSEVKVLGALGRGHLAQALRTGFDPYARVELTALETVDRTRHGLAPHNAGPLGAREHWEHYRCDGAYHATFWIGGWPRVGVSPTFMDALLSSSDTVRTVAVTFEPVPAERSAREVEAAITRDRADSELRRRFGQSETARQRQAQEAAMRREAELAAGHGEVRLAGFVTVSGRDEQELNRACTEIHQHAARARLELHRLYGQQAEAFNFTLPLARGLR